MAYTEKVSLSGTALSFLLYECINSVNSQEGFLIGDVTSEITNHISDSQNDNARLDTQVVIRTVLPLPTVSLFYLPSGNIRENMLSELLSTSANDVVGWYKYRKNTSIHPTFRDKLISRGLQKYFEKHHGKKIFVTCNLSSKFTTTGSTHSFTYRFGKMNCYDIYEYVEDVTANLGEKLTGYKKTYKNASGSVFNDIIKETNVQNNNTEEAILHIQEAVDVRLLKEAQIAAKNENVIRELEAEIKQMSTILSDKLSADLQAEYDRMIEERFLSRDIEMANACVKSLKTPLQVDILNMPNDLMHNHHHGDSEITISSIDADSKEKSSSPILKHTETQTTKPPVNYAAALINNAQASTSKAKDYGEDLITFEDENKYEVPSYVSNDNVKCYTESSPEY